MRIALDVMGGDHAPHEIVHGAVEASLKLKDIAIDFDDIQDIELRGRA